MFALLLFYLYINYININFPFPLKQTLLSLNHFNADDLQCPNVIDILIVRSYQAHRDVVFIRNYPILKIFPPLPDTIFSISLICLPIMNSIRPRIFPLLPALLSLSGRIFFILSSPPIGPLYQLVGLISCHLIAEQRLDSPRIKIRGFPPHLLTNFKTPPSLRSLQECDFT